MACNPPRGLRPPGAHGRRRKLRRQFCDYTERTMQRLQPPFRADHVGSLLRPPRLLQARESAKRNELSAQQLRAIEDEAIREAVRMQEDAGLSGITDGEFRRGSWHMDFLYQIGGVAKVQSNLNVRFSNETGDLEFPPAALRVVANLQLDDTSLAYLNDPEQRSHVASIGGDAELQHLTYIQLINAAIANRPAGMTVCTHMCRGNFRSSWVASGGYDHVAEALFGQLEVDGFFLEYDDARSGGFEPLRFVPKNKIVVLGLITTKRGAIESKDMLKRRIEEASKYVPLEQLCLSPQCGFSSTVEGNSLTLEEQMAKLRLVAETAREVWG